MQPTGCLLSDLRVPVCSAMQNPMHNSLPDICKAVIDKDIAKVKKLLKKEHSIEACGDPDEGGKLGAAMNRPIHLAVIQVFTAVTLVVIGMYCSW